MFCPPPEADANAPPAEAAGGITLPVTKLVTSSASAADETDLLQQAVAAIAARLNAPSVRVWSLSEEADRLRLEAAFGLDLPFDGLQDNIPVAKSDLGDVVSGGAPYVVDCSDASTPPEVRTWAKRYGITSFLAVPIFVQQRTWGVLAVFSHSPELLSQCEPMQILADFLGRGIANAHKCRSPTGAADLLPSLVQCVPCAIITLDRRGNVTRWNRMAEVLFGWSEAEVLGKPLPLVPDERRHEFPSAAAPEAAESGVVRSQTVCRCADESRRHVQRTTAPLYDTHGQIVGRLEVFSDDSQRIHTSRCLHVQAQVTRVLTSCGGLGDAAPLWLAAIGEWLRADVCEFWSLDAERASLTRTAVWAAESSVRERLSAADIHVKPSGSEWPAAVQQIREVTYSDDVASVAVGVLSPSRVLHVPVAGLAIPIRREDRALGVVTCLGVSLTQPDEVTRQTLHFIGDAMAQFLARLKTEAALAQAESNLRQSQKMDAIGLLAGGVAHDFNNLLTIILAYGEMGLSEVDEGHPWREFFAEIHGAGERAAAMTRQLLAVSRQQPTRIVACSLNDLVRDMERMLQRLVGSRIVLTRQCEDALGTVQADVSQLEQVLLNLVVNARDAMPEGGNITLSTRNVTLTSDQARAHDVRPGPYVELAVTDTGCGMDAATQLRIFEPFFTTKAAGRGTGMGLATVFGIVRQSGGVMCVESEPDVGSRFCVVLPQTRCNLSVQSYDEPPETSPVGTERILVAENDETIRALIRRLLEVRGYSVQEAAHGGEALEILKQRKARVDLVLADIQMPFVDGLALAREIAATSSGPKVLLMSANSMPPVEPGTDAARHFLSKPFTSAELARQVRRALDG